MMPGKPMHLGAFFFTPGSHSAGWRHPDAVPETDMSFSHYVSMAQTAERGLLDCLFFQDTAAVVGSGALHGGSPWRPGTGRQVFPEPATLVAALAAVTQKIGLVATATTTYGDPYTVARRFGSIDHISGGRAGWNLVTSQIEDEAGNFGFDSHPGHAERYERAEEFHDVVCGLWDSFEEGAFPRDKQTGQFLDTGKAHILNHAGRHFRVRGPLNLPRCPQGRPVIAQAGSSGPGKQLASRVADMIFTAQSILAEGQTFYRDVKARAAEHGRDPDHVKIMPGLMVVTAPTEEEAQAKYRSLEALVDDETAIALLSRLCGDLDIRSYPVDGPLPELPPSNAARARQEHLVAKARREKLTIRQVARYLGTSLGHHMVVGAPAKVADVMQEWLQGGACDGFMLLFPYYPKPLEDVVDHLVPELQRRGLFRTAYEGSTLRQHLGIPEPRNRYAL
ncbi:LLM class flavin-dependent oxidoreductase [Roseomonas marmotae]|uniref:LLM class flavin-dependent oxidoreductase n=1 Tax=Roseomonas marmotae TaxID=2768161 RepID=A0ABS3KFE9_9PROT|nr:LLM class flavin-dependent oxidoreductase [Roseomonas marmotae]MBO1076192.1 LLM class flavin-dependent oxidoreductase [Roseomonas marmotae]QTI81772.1 LLM class flavin-dependent oxidoreductase [Roseomonas marmotae]